MLSRKTLTIGIILIAVLGISACIETNHEVKASVVVTSANEPADANNPVGATPVADTSADEKSPVWSPDGGKIFFKSGDWICVCNPDGSQKEKLAEVEGWSLVFDPDMERAFYSKTISDEDETTHCAYVMDIDGKNQKKIAELTLENKYVDDGGYIGSTRRDQYEICSVRIGQKSSSTNWKKQATPGYGMKRKENGCDTKLGLNLPYLLCPTIMGQGMI